MKDTSIMEPKNRYDSMDNKCLDFGAAITEDISYLMAENGNISK